MPFLSDTSYRPPAAEYYPGDRVRFDGDIYTVVDGTHTHTQLEGIDQAIANWELKLAYRKRKKKTSAITDTSKVSARKGDLRKSPDPCDHPGTLGSPEETTTVSEDFEAPKPTAWELFSYQGSLIHQGFAIIPLP
jgi:hypothetical protein